MVTREQISRINELYKKQQEQCLTQEEKEEQASLRRLYVDSVKENLTAQLKNIKIVYPSGHSHGPDCDCGCSGHKRKGCD